LNKKPRRLISIEKARDLKRAVVNRTKVKATVFALYRSIVELYLHLSHISHEYF